MPGLRQSAADGMGMQNLPGLKPRLRFSVTGVRNVALSKSPSRPCEAPLPLYQRRARSRIPSCPTSRRKIEQRLLYASAPPRGAWPCPPPETTDAWISALQALKSLVFGRPGTEGCALDHRKSAPQASIASPAKRTTTRGPSTTSRTEEPASASSAN